MRKFLCFLALAMCLCTFGCATEKSTIFSSGYWKRHFAKFGEDLHEFRVDIDRTIFDLEDRPIEDH